MPGDGGAGEILFGFDFGELRIGVAVGNTISGTARELAVIDARPAARRYERLQALIVEWQPGRLVVGRPLHPDGTPHPMTAACERFARQLAGRFRRPVDLVDERYSSVEARREVGPGEADDAAAAAVVLRQYLDERARR